MAKQRFNGIVVGNKMDKTAVVEVERKAAHPKYKKVLKLKKKYYAHTQEPLEIGDSVIIEQVRPMSKTKRWMVVDNLNKKSSKKKNSKK
jgi:small subunit ribosomal protein S17